MSGADYRKADKSIIGGAIGANHATNTTAFADAQGGGVGHAVQIRAEQYVPFSCVMSLLHVHTHQAPGAGETLTFTLMVNGNASALEAQIAGAAATEAADVVNEVGVAAGDYITMRIVSSLNAAGAFPTWLLQVKS